MSTSIVQLTQILQTLLIKERRKRVREAAKARKKTQLKRETLDLSDW